MNLFSSASTMIPIQSLAMIPHNKEQSVFMKTTTSRLVPQDLNNFLSLAVIIPVVRENGKQN